MFFLTDFFIFEFLILLGVYTIIRIITKTSWRTIQSLVTLEKVMDRIGGNIKRYVEETSEKQQESIKTDIQTLAQTQGEAIANITTIATRVEKAEAAIQTDNKAILQGVRNSAEQILKKIESSNPSPSSTNDTEEAIVALAKAMEQQGVYLYDQFAQITASQSEITIAQTEIIAAQTEIVAAQTEQERKLQTLQDTQATAPTDDSAINRDLITQSVERMASATNSRLELMVEKITRLQTLQESQQPLGSAAAYSSVNNEMLSQLVNRLAMDMNSKMEMISSNINQVQLLQEKASPIGGVLPAGGVPPGGGFGGASELPRLIDRFSAEMNVKIELMSDKITSHISDKQVTTVEQINNLLITKIHSTPSTSMSTEPRLPDMLASCLPIESYMLGTDINGHAAAALLTMPGDDGPVALDDKLNLEEMRYIMDDSASADARADSRVRFGRTLTQHVNKIASTLIAPPATGDRALLFVSSEPAYAEIQTYHQHIAELAMAQGVWIVSPTTLLAALNTARAQEIVDQARNFENQLQEIGDYIGRAMQSVKRAENAGVQLVGRMRSDGQPSLTDDETR